jgi:hypothetical protein
VPLTGQDAFEAPPLRPLRYLSVVWICRERTFDYIAALDLDLAGRITQV